MRLKRERSRDNIGGADMGPASPLWSMPAVLYHHVASFFGEESFWDHWHFSRTNRALWYYYHAHDPCIQILQHHLFCLYVRTNKTKKERFDGIFNTANLRCLQWMWERDASTSLKAAQAIRFLEMGATRGKLEVITHFERYIRDEQERISIRLRLMDRMVSHGHDDGACKLWLETQHLTNDTQKARVFTIASINAHLAPNFLALVIEACFDVVRKLVNIQTSDYNQTNMFVIFALISILCSDRRQEHCFKAFLHFWDKVPHLHTFVARELCFISCTSAVTEHGPDNSWGNLIAHLPFILSTQVNDPAMETTSPLSVHWTFPAFSALRPGFDIRCDAVKVDTEFQEIDCRFSFRCRDLGVELNVVFTLPARLTPFEIK